MTRTRIGALLVGAMVGVLALAGCSSAASGDSGTGGTELSLVGFAVPKAANDAAQALWGQTADGKGVAWTTSYGASGDQSRAVVAGLEADYVHFSVEQRRDPAGRRRARRRGLERRRRPRASSRTRSWCSSCARATRRTSRAGTTSSSPASGSSPRTRAPPARPAGTSSRRGRTSSRTAAPRRRRRRTSPSFFEQRRRAARQRPRRDHRVPGRHRRRAALLRERGDPRPPERRGLRLHRPATPLLDREPGRRHRGRQPEGQGATSTSC